MTEMVLKVATGKEVGGGWRLEEGASLGLFCPNTVEASIVLGESANTTFFSENWIFLSPQYCRKSYNKVDKKHNNVVVEGRGLVTTGKCRRPTETSHLK